MSIESQAFFDPAAVSRLSRISLSARHPMLGGVSGQHKSAARGSSVEFAEYRKYVPGDDIRYVDWRVFGRTDKFFIKEFEADTNLRCYLIMDTSSSMAFEADHGTKFDYARRMAATLGYLLIKQGDAVGLTTFDEKRVHEIPAKTSPTHVKTMFDILGKVEPKGATEIVQTLHDMAEKISSRALVIVISDFFQEIEPLLDGFQHMRYRNHDVTVFHLLDKQEVDFDFDRPIRFKDMESTFDMVTDPSVIGRGYREALDNYLAAFQKGCRQSGVDYQRVTTDTDYEKVLSSFLLERIGMKGKSKRG